MSVADEIDKLWKGPRNASEVVVLDSVQYRTNFSTPDEWDSFLDGLLETSLVSVPSNTEAGNGETPMGRTIPPPPAAWVPNGNQCMLCGGKREGAFPACATCQPKLDNMLERLKEEGLVTDEDPKPPPKATESGRLRRAITLEDE